MDGLEITWVRSKPVNQRAVCFDGSQALATAILAWVRRLDDTLEGHFRAPLGGSGGALFIPTFAGVLRIDAGDWIVESGSDTFFYFPAAGFLEKHDVIGSLLQ